MTLPMSKIG